MAHDTTEVLNRLIQVNKDAEDGYITAAENIRNSELETVFKDYANRHAKFAADLQQEVDRVGGATTPSGTAAGTIRRGWIDLKSTLSGHSAGSLLNSCVDIEESAEIAYNDAADAIRTGQPHTLIGKHLQQIREFRTRLARLVNETEDGVEFQANE